MKKILFFGLCLMAMASCQQDNKQAQQLALNQQRDSLDKIIAQKDNEINDIIGTLNDIEEGFREISEAEGRVAVAKRGEGASSVARIRENMQFIQSTMQQNRELIGKLRQKLRESTINTEQLKRTIDNLTAQLEEKNAELQKLRAIDREKNTDYFNTLKTYLENERSIPKTSEALIIHRTTLQSRLEKIAQLTHLNLDSQDVRMYLNLSFRILDYVDATRPAADQ